MDTQFKLLSVNVYDDKHRYIDKNLTYIPKNIKIVVEKFLDKNIQNLIKIGKFNIDDVDSYSYGGAGCGDNLRTSYVNSELCKFAITQYYDGSILDVTIEFNENFNNETAFTDIINGMKTIQQLWENTLREMAIHEVQHLLWKKIRTNMIISDVQIKLLEQLCDMDEDDA